MIALFYITNDVSCTKFALLSFNLIGERWVSRAPFAIRAPFNAVAFSIEHSKSSNVHYCEQENKIHSRGCRYSSIVNSNNSSVNLISKYEVRENFVDMVIPSIFNKLLRVNTSDRTRPDNHEEATSSVRGFGKCWSSKFQQMSDPDRWISKCGG